MKGFRTLGINILLAIAPVLQATSAVDIGLDGNAAAIYAVFITLVNVGLRFLTTTPVAKSTPAKK